MKRPTSDPHADHHLHVAAGVILFLIVVLLVIAGGAYLANQIWSPEMTRRSTVSLPRPQREAVVLHHLQGASLAEVAAQLQRTEAAVAGLLHRGLKQLRQLLDK